MWEWKQYQYTDTNIKNEKEKNKSLTHTPSLEGMISMILNQNLDFNWSNRMKFYKIIEFLLTSPTEQIHDSFNLYLFIWTVFDWFDTTGNLPENRWKNTCF